ncbi:hypothetical protein As57867_002736, partial [Aphanomyces stellatus]
RVAVIMGRCLEFTIGLLAALKIGGVMVPVDATFPIQRISYMLSDANAAAIITTDAHVARLQELDSDIPVHSVSSEGLHQTPCNFKVSQEQIRNPTDEAYIVYTSGSTGKPKGVPVFHEGAVNAMMSSLSNAGFVEGARVMQFMAIGFDVCLWEIWKTLSMGATLVFRTEDLSKKIGTVDVLMCTPTALSLLGDPSAYPSLKTIFVGGEAIPSALKDIWCPFANVYNCYGPSECSITTHFGELTVNTRVDLGKPIENSTCYILDNAQRPVPIGVVGEMCLGGIGVCRGYINLPDQSAERFIADPFRAGGRMYRSGDLGRLLPNGRFEILGRQDTQVKLKGYRIELDEVAEAMMQHPGVIAAAAIVKDKTHLVGYYSPATVDAQELQEIVVGLLPTYMVPSVWVGLEVMPQNTNGKIDKKVLEAMEVVIEVEALETEVEKQMANVWSQVLNVDLGEIGRHTSFYALGGDSISIVKVVSALRQIGLFIAVPQLVKAVTIARAAAIVTSEDTDVYPSVALPLDILDAIQAETTRFGLKDHVAYPATPLQSLMLRETGKNRQNYLLQTSLNMPADMDVFTLTNAFKTVVQRNELLRTTFVQVESTFYQVIQTHSDALQVTMHSVDRLDDFLAMDEARGFQLGDTSFIRLALVRDATAARHAVLTIHHTLYDGWSFPMLQADIFDAYNNKPLVERPPFRSIVDYIQAKKDASNSFWLSYFHDVPTLEALTWPSTDDDDDSVPQTFAVVDVSVATETLTDMANQMGVPMSTLLQFAWAMTLNQYSRQNVVVFANTLANRSIPVRDVDRVLGPLINTVPCRVHFGQGVSLKHALGTFHSEYAALMSHAFADMDEIKHLTGLNDALGETLFSYQHFPTEDKSQESSTSPAPLNFEVKIRQDTDPNKIEIDYSYMLAVAPKPSTMNALEITGIHNPKKMSTAQSHKVAADYNATLLKIVQMLSDK